MQANVANICPKSCRWTPTWNKFVHFGMLCVPNRSGQMKSAKMIRSHLGGIKGRPGADLWMPFTDFRRLPPAVLKHVLVFYNLQWNVFLGALFWHICVNCCGGKNVISNIMCMITHWSVLIETRQYPVMIRSYYVFVIWIFQLDSLLTFRFSLYDPPPPFAFPLSN